MRNEKNTPCLILVVSQMRFMKHPVTLHGKLKRKMHKIYGMYLEKKKKKLALETKNNMGQESKAIFSYKELRSKYFKLCGPHSSLSHTSLLLFLANLKKV